MADRRGSRRVGTLPYTQMEAGQFATNGTPDSGHLAPGQAHQATRLAVTAFPQRERPVHECSSVIECVRREDEVVWAAAD